MELLRKLSYTEMVSYIEENQMLCKKLYFNSNLTAREVAETLKIAYNSN